jgi:lysophospholipase L1-like esterase
LRDSLQTYFSENDSISLEIIAQTGWTTSNLKSAITAAEPSSDFDLVTLLIGVNNQYQNKPFSLYQTEFIELTNTAITLANGDASKLIVVSIPDYAYTPFGQNYNQSYISEQLLQYNDYAETYCNENNLNYVYITDITQQGLTNTELVATDNLHPSELAYTKFVERILPLALEVLEQ